MKRVIITISAVLTAIILIVLTAAVLMIFLTPQDGVGKLYSYQGFYYKFEIENLTTDEEEVHELLSNHPNLTIISRTTFEYLSSTWTVMMKTSSVFLDNDTVIFTISALSQMSDDINWIRISIDHTHETDLPLERMDEADRMSEKMFEEHKNEALNQDLEIQVLLEELFGNDISSSYYEKNYLIQVD